MSTDETPLTGRTTWLITAVAVIAASAPHAFFAPPLQLHMEGQMQAWLGIAVWAPAILAGVAFFFGVEFGGRNEERATSVLPPTRAAVLVLAVLGYVMAAAVLHIDRWTGMATMRPWDELQVVLPLFVVLGALRALFFQGFVQQRVLAALPSASRVAVLCGLELLIALPFLASGNTSQVALGLLPLVLTDALLGAITHEIGYPVRIAMLVRAFAGGAFIWFQQAMLL